MRERKNERMRKRESFIHLYMSKTFIDIVKENVFDVIVMYIQWKNRSNTVCFSITVQNKMTRVAMTSAS